MEIKKFRAPSIQAALARVREELGPDASVLATKELAPTGWSAMLGRANEVEVTASRTIQVPSRLAPRRTAPREPYSGRAIPNLENPLEVGLDLSEFEVTPSDASSPSPSDISRILAEVFDELQTCEVPTSHARGIMRALAETAPRHVLEDPKRVREFLRFRLAERITCGGPIEVGTDRPRIVALVGPTGVGKTTTIAKLAATFHLQQQLRVGLITIDTFRIAAIQQLQTYAEIIDLPMEIVANAEEMQAARQRLDHCDLILIDTAGRSPADLPQLDEIGELLEVVAPDEIHLVVSMTSSVSALEKTAAAFARIGPTSLLLTKLDEAATLGALLPLTHGCRLPLSYLTDGQRVPDDLKVANSTDLVELLLRPTLDQR